MSLTRVTKGLDILRELSVPELSKFYEILKLKLPKAILGHHYLHNHINWFKRFQSGKESETNVSDRCRTKFYTHRNGILENCTFIAITGEKDYWILLFSLQESGDELVEAFEKTELINWKVRPTYISVESQHFQRVCDVLDKKRVICTHGTPEQMFTIPKEITSKYKIRDTGPAYIAPLKLDDCYKINEYWHHKYPGSHEFIKSIIRMNGGTGIYHKKSHELLSWMMTSDNMATGFWQTLDTAKSHGFGQIVFQTELKRLADVHNLDAFGFILKGNKISEQLTIKFGGHVFGTLHWIQILKQPESKL